MPEEVRRRDDDTVRPAIQFAQGDERRDVLRAEAHATPRRTVALSVRAHVLLVIRDHALAGDSKGVCTVRDEQTMLFARARGVHPRVARTLELWEELLGPVDLLQGVIIGENRASGQNETQAYLEAAYRGVVRENLAVEHVLPLACFKAVATWEELPA